MELFLIRHGETDENAKGIIQGWMDTDLNENGLKQAHDAAEKFNGKIEAIYSSDLKRAKQTAQQFRAKYPDVPFIEDERLRERGFGDATGKERRLYDWDAFWDPDDPTTIPNVETLDDFNARVQSFIDELRQSEFSCVLIVTHSGTINRFLDLLGEYEGHTTRGNASVTRLEI